MTHDLLEDFDLPIRDFAFNLETHARLSQLRVLMNLPSEGQVIEELVRRTGAPSNGRVHGAFQMVCAGCGREFDSNRRQLPGKRSWCGRAECKKVAAAERARGYRDRKSGGE